MTEWVSIRDAAERLGVSPDAIRRRLRSGQLQGRQQPTPQGHVWLVALDDDADAATPVGAAVSANGHATPPGAMHQAPGTQYQAPGATRYAPDGASRQAVDDADDADDNDDDEVIEAPAAAAALIAAQRAEEMARYTATLLEPWRRRVEEQAEEIGVLKTKLDYAVGERAERDATGEEVGRLKAELEQTRQRVAEFEAARRPWWRFWD
ncbi:MAG TPA: hypothetical protein VNK05_00410 [Chloroflexota bacterium]|nr:hypothetical protein [Chloroflexota bacterium]